MFRNLIDVSQNTVLCLALEGEIPQNYENCSNTFQVFLGNAFTGMGSLIPQFAVRSKITKSTLFKHDNFQDQTECTSKLPKVLKT